VPHQKVDSNETLTALVGILNLQVILAPEGDTWIAQAIEFDYAAGGSSEEDVKQRFEDGLYATIQEHFRMFGHLDNLLDTKPPIEVWVDLVKAKELQAERFSQISIHRFMPPDYFPFKQIRYFIPKSGRSDMEA